MNIFGLCCVRNGADIIGVVAAYHLAVGFDRLIIVDDGSNDGTSEILERLARATGRIEVIRNDSAAYDQGGMTTAAARHAMSQGADYILPFDADEFYSFKRGLRPTLAPYAPAIVRVTVTNFVQSRSVQRGSTLSLLRAGYRPWVRGGEASIEVAEGRCAFIEAPLVSKVIAPAQPGLEFDMGNHQAIGIAAEERRALDIEILHLPLRARAVLTQRTEDYEPRIARMRDTESFGWQSLYFKRCAERGMLEREWRANSQRHGALDIDGRSVPLIPDNRFRICVLRALPILVAARLGL
jgi:glycosyltransferase involved in cell wall biosynthesis